MSWHYLCMACFFVIYTWDAILPLVQLVVFFPTQDEHKLHWPPLFFSFLFLSKHTSFNFMSLTCFSFSMFSHTLWVLD
ncbi:hypothetical protein GLYMA_12G016800v4 [Glycine max]|uniref:Uncharacterized protein n=1 Tax=Glycine max TaxID=3847 RepID=K7LSH0_SOYBN|nr:hypothetical protein GYH30_032405 [Glycine max]KRH24015.1 hypothetical protein GLYMA_12G016800v4 [Glycine max]